LTSLDISSNNLVSFKLPEGWSGPDSDGDYKSPGGDYQKESPEGTEPILDGVNALVDGIKDNGALTSINIEENKIPAARKKEIYQLHVVRMNKLKVALSDKTLTELDVSSINFGAESAKLVAQYISDNGAISKFTFSGDSIYSKPVTMETTMTVVDFSGTRLGGSGAIMLSAFLPKCT
jgi:hypothetical protein